WRPIPRGGLPVVEAGGIYQTPCEGSMLAGLSADGDVLAGIAGQSCGAGPGSFARARLRALHARSPWFRALPERWRARAPAHFHTAPAHDPGARTVGSPAMPARGSLYRR